MQILRRSCDGLMFLQASIHRMKLRGNSSEPASRRGRSYRVADESRVAKTGENCLTPVHGIWSAHFGPRRFRIFSLAGAIFNAHSGTKRSSGKRELISHIREPDLSRRKANAIGVITSVYLKTIEDSCFY
ncbi:hypothetical protein [Burkholderia sp. S171]|uniref:hypothetical protein n=1 Tax=Burkholderia sp. S171 TaxID=1641860 RepID=UPI00131CBF0E|nr:hypothetical protein [Burkholderia sp. S171]